MKRISVALVFGLMLVCGSSLFAQSKPQTPNELEAVADEILQLKEEHRQSQLTATVWLGEHVKSLDSKKQRDEQLKQDLARIKALMQEAQGSGVVNVNGNEISIEQLNHLAKHTLDKLSGADSETSNTRKIARDCRDALSDLIAAEAEAVETAKEFKTAIENFRQKLSRQHMMLLFAKSKFDSQFKFARELQNENPRVMTFDAVGSTGPVPSGTSDSASSFKALEDEIESIAKDLENAGNKDQAVQLRQKARVLLNRSGN